MVPPSGVMILAPVVLSIDSITIGITIFVVRMLISENGGAADHRRTLVKDPNVMINI